MYSHTSNKVSNTCGLRKVKGGFLERNSFVQAFDNSKHALEYCYKRHGETPQFVIKCVLHIPTHFDGCEYVASDEFYEKMIPRISPTRL